MKKITFMALLMPFILIEFAINFANTKIQAATVTNPLTTDLATNTNTLNTTTSSSSTPVMSALPTLRAAAVQTLYSGTMGTCRWTIDANGLLTIYSGTLPSNSPVDVNSIVYAGLWANYAGSIKSIYVEPGVKTAVLASRYFSGLPNLVSADLTNLDTSQSTDLSQMFEQDTSLTTAVVSHFNMSKVTSIARMFSNTAITDMDLSAWDVSHVQLMTRLFYMDADLTNVNVANWNTSQAQIMMAVFNGDASLKTLDISNWTASKVQNFSSMFAACPNLESIKMDNWNMDSATNIGYMFSGDKSLKTVDLSRWNTSNVTQMGSLFQNCSSLTQLDTRRINTSNVTDMSMAFQNDSSLTSIDVSNWNTSQVVFMSSIFKGMTGLRQLDLTNWNTLKVTNMNNSSNILNFGTGSHLWHLILGRNMKVPTAANFGIPAAPGNNTPIIDDSTTNTYQSISGNWQEVGTGSLHAPNGGLYTPDQIMALYATTGTPTRHEYVWQQQPSLNLAMTVPNLDFGKIAAGVGTYGRTDPNWSISISNYSIPTSNLNANLTVAMTKPFTSTSGQTLNNILVFRDAKNQDSVITSTPQSVYTGVLSDANQSKLSWDQDQGFLLNVKPEDTIRAGNYTANLTWNMTISI